MSYYKSYSEWIEWIGAVEAANLDQSYWGGCGSCGAVSNDGIVVGEWLAEYDCDNGVRPHGWLSSNYC